MVGRMRSDDGDLLVIFARDGEPDDELAVAPTGEHALKAAVAMLMKRDALRHGDTLTVQRNGGADLTMQDMRFRRYDP
jgi:hypothetical protein